MSRHDLDPFNPAHEVVVGWDPPTGTYFAQVLNTAADEESDAYTVLWIGTNFGEVPDLGTILATVRPYAHVPDSLVDDLLEDFICDE